MTSLMFHRVGILGSCLMPVMMLFGEDPANLMVECEIWKMGGGVGGCGVLARYPAPGPGRVAIERTTKLGKEAGLPPITLLKVVDPSGRTVASAELTDQDRSVLLVDVPIPDGPAGIWRISVQGGRVGDRIGFVMPPAMSWGIRGEMALGQVAGAGRVGWLWIPPGTGEVLMEALGGGTIALADQAGNPVSGIAEGKRTLWRWPRLEHRTAMRVTVSPGTRALAIDGVVGLLCPDAASATDLHGGSIEESGRSVEGPLQARARRWMVAAALRDLDPHLGFPETLPADIPDPIAAVQLYGAYGPLSGLRSACGAQVLDQNRWDFGSLGGTPDRTLHGPAISTFDALGLAAAVDADTALNPAHGSRVLAMRAAMMAFFHISRLQGDDLIREGDIATSGYPITHAFFIYLGSLAAPYPLLRPYLDPEAAAIWRDGIIAVGDRLADYRGYQTNQWWHVVLGHLHAYRSTGEIRFLRWFERHVREMISRPGGPIGKFGQHPAGYFLEEYGPDGNYDAISGTCLVEAWNAYRMLPAADPDIVAVLHGGIERNLAFASCHWMPQPDGSVVGPTSMMTRKVFSFPGQGWPGTRLARDAFPMASAQWLLTRMPLSGIGIADLLPHLVNTDAWARRALAEQLPHGDAKYPTASRGIPAAWTEAAVRVAQRPVASPAVIPCRVSAGLWDLPGQIAWKQGPLYGLVFWGVPGSKSPASSCRIGGAPTALWSEATGTFLLSQHNNHFEDGSPVGNNGVTSIDDLTHACIFGSTRSGLWWSGREQADLTWRVPGTAFRISGRAESSLSPVVSWDYGIEDGGVVLTATATLDGLEGPMINLPLLVAGPGVDIAIGPVSARFKAGTGSVVISWDGEADGAVTAALVTGIPKIASAPVRCLRIALLSRGGAWVQRVRIVVEP